MEGLVGSGLPQKCTKGAKAEGPVIVLLDLLVLVLNRNPIQDLRAFFL